MNNSWFDIAISLLGIAELCAILYCMNFRKNKVKLATFNLFIGFSLGSSIALFTILHTIGVDAYAHTFFLIQNISYLIEVCICIQLAEIILRNNLAILMIFGPTISTLMVFMIVTHMVPKSIEDITYPSYTATLLCGFALFTIWIFQKRLSRELQPPYSIITGAFGAYISIRFFITFFNQYFSAGHWPIVGRLYPINEVIFLGIILYALVFRAPHNVVVLPVSLTIDNMMAVCRNCGEEFPNHSKNCKYKRSLSVSAN